MAHRVRAAAAFVYDLVIGEDAWMALGLVVAVAVTYGLSRAAVPSWWVLPAAIVVLFTLSVNRARKRA